MEPYRTVEGECDATEPVQPMTANQIMEALVFDDHGVLDGILRESGLVVDCKECEMGGIALWAGDNVCHDCGKVGA